MNGEFYVPFEPNEASAYRHPGLVSRTTTVATLCTGPQAVDVLKESYKLLPGRPAKLPATAAEERGEREPVAGTNSDTGPCPAMNQWTTKADRPTVRSGFTETRPKPQTSTTRSDHSKVAGVVPALDLSSLNVDEDAVSGACVHSKENHSTKDGPFFLKKRTMPFVFPKEHSLSNYTSGQGQPSHQDSLEDQKNANSKNNVGYHEIPTVSSLPATECFLSYHSHSANNQAGGTLSFSLSNPKLGKYLLEDCGAHEDTNGNVHCENQKQKLINNKHKNKTEKRVDNADSEQEVIRVILVDGNSDSDYDGRNATPATAEINEEISETSEANISESYTEKPQKNRVTFSFDNCYSPHGNIKRYTPIKNDANISLQSVLKKRPPPPQPEVQAEPPYDTRTEHVTRDGRYLLGGSYRLEQQLPNYLEHGIPVKHLHATSSDLALDMRRTRTSETAIIQKPPVPSSTRMSMSSGEKAGSAGAARRIPFTRGLSYASLQNNSRGTNFRHLDASKATRGEVRPRSRSAEDLQSDDDKAHTQGSRQRSSLPFTLRRCASSEQSFLPHSKSRPAKAKVAFGSFVIPKEATTRLKQAQVKFEDVGLPSQPLGSYVHAHTRRSPYAVHASHLTQRDNLRHGTHTGQKRPFTAQTRPHQQEQQQQQRHQQRHSAPSSYGSKREISWSSQNKDRLSIDSTPNRPPPATLFTTSGRADRVRPEARASSAISGVECRRSSRELAALNLMANKARNASHYRFLTAMQTRSHEKEMDS